jgi:hypothetical protein
MTIATINRFIQLLADAFGALHAEVSMHEIERQAMLVHSAMENKRRAYHSSSHVFHMCKGMNPRQVLAAIFHDVVYYQLDVGFPQQAATLLEPVVRNENGTLVLNAIAKNDTALQLCAGVFRFEPDQDLPLFGGMNEFLSAVVAVRLLQPHLEMPDLIAIVACIEATVPFRGKDAKGRDPAFLLAGRLREQSRKLLGTPSNEEIERHVGQVMLDAVKFANRDVDGFAEPNPGKFLSATWQLIEESNTPLVGVGVYTLQDYRGALSRMEKFLGGLNPDNIFHHYNHFPDDAEFARLNEAARKNLAFACDYLGAKITSIAIIEALALETGGNCPVSMFLGDIHSPDGKPDRVEDFLPPVSIVTELKSRLLLVLEQGRARESSNDLTSSPLTAFIYRCMGHEKFLQALQQAKRMFAGELSPLEFLKSLDPEMVRAIIGACAHIAISRREALQKLEASFPSEQQYVI